MRGADREYDEDDEAGAEESDPGYAQDSHALEKDISWRWGGTAGKGGKVAKMCVDTNSLPCSGNWPIRIWLAVAFAMLLGSKDISSKRFRLQLARWPSHPSPSPCCWARAASYRSRQILSAPLWCIAAFSFHTIILITKILHKLVRPQDWGESEKFKEKFLQIWHFLSQ